MLEVARRYPIDGLHLDYIRYPDGECCYCDGCRKRFEADSGRRVERLAGRLLSAARGRRSTTIGACRQITRLVAAIHREVKKIRPGLKISAAVWGGYPDCRRWVAQDWPAWIRAGYLDFVCPMDYTDEPRAVCRLGPAADETGRRADSGLSRHRRDGFQQRAFGRRRGGANPRRPQLGAGGFSIFNFDHATAGVDCAGGGPGRGPHAGRSAASGTMRKGKGEGGRRQGTVLLLPGDFLLRYPVRRKANFVCSLKRVFPCTSEVRAMKLLSFPSSDRRDRFERLFEVAGAKTRRPTRRRPPTPPRPPSRRMRRNDRRAQDDRHVQGGRHAQDDDRIQDDGRPSYTRTRS